jgi:hypothetical protein
MTMLTGRMIFREKWGHRDCDIREVGLKLEDQWRTVHDWQDEFGADSGQVENGQGGSIRYTWTAWGKGT